MIAAQAGTTVDFDDDKLKLLGWGGREPPKALDAPEQARALEPPREGEGWIFLDWKTPTDGGKVASYKIERRDRANVTRKIPDASGSPRALLIWSKSWRADMARAGLLSSRPMEPTAPLPTAPLGHLFSLDKCGAEAHSSRYSQSTDEVAE